MYIINIYSVNIVISLTLFLFIFLDNINESGGDMIIFIFSFIACILHEFALFIYIMISKRKNYRVFIVVLLLNIMYSLFMKYFGYDVRNLLS